jgi:hypothetical protein
MKGEKQYSTIQICKTIIALNEACELMSDNLTSKDDRVVTFMEPYKKIELAIQEQIKLLAYKHGLSIEE